MAELARAPAYNLGLRPINPPNVAPLLASTQIPTIPPIQSADDKSAAARIALIQSVGNMLAKLPGQIQDYYQQQKERKLQDLVIAKKQEVLASGDLSGVRFTPGNEFSYDPITSEEKALQGIRLKEAEAQLRAQDARIKFYQTKAQPVETDYDAMLRELGGGAKPSGESQGYAAGEMQTATGSVFGFPGDPNDITDADVPGFSATEGAWGAPIKDPSLKGVALPPDLLVANGVNINDPSGHEVEVTVNGKTRRYPIVDKLGKKGRIDFTQAAYDEMGGPKEKGGGLIPGVQYRIIPKGAPVGEIAAGGALPVAAPDSGAGTEMLIPRAEVNLPTARGSQAPRAEINLAAAPMAMPPLVIPSAPRDPAPPLANAAGTMTLDPATGIVTRTDAEGRTFVSRRGPGGRVDWTQTKGGVKFQSAAAARDAGYDPTGAQVNPDGSVLVTTYKPSGTDVRGRAKITDTQKSALTSASILAKSIDGLMGSYDDLTKKGMAGPIAGRIEKGKQALGIGSEEGSQVQAEMNTALFRIARMLNGAGVLTDKDIARATAVAPTITMGRSQFKGQLEAVKGVMSDSLETWLQTNAGQATDEQVELAKKAIESLSGAAPGAEIGATAGATGGAPAAPATPAGPRATVGTQENPYPVNSPEEREKVPVGSYMVNAVGAIVRKGAPSGK